MALYILEIQIIRNLRLIVFTLGGSIIETVSKYKYLGVILDEHLTFNEYAKTLADAGGRALSKIIGKFRNFKEFN